MKKSGLGRGVSALMGDDFTDIQLDSSVDKEFIRLLDVNLIDVNKAQPRKTFNNETIAALAESIKANGMLQPITVHSVGDRYEIVAGERRYRACRLLKMDKIPAIIKELSPRQVSELALVENLQREDLNPIEEAMAIETLMREFSLTQQEVSSRIGFSRPAIANAVRLLQLDSKIQAMISSGELSAGHGRALAALDAKTAIALAEACVNEGWSVRALEQKIKTLENKPAKKVKTRDADFVRVEEKLCQSLGTRVKINGSDKKGKIEIEYFNRDDLERLLSLLSPDADF